MIRTNVLRITLSCALLLLPAAGGVAWAADSGLNYSSPDADTWFTPSKPNHKYQAGTYTGTVAATDGDVKIYTTNHGNWIVFGGYSPANNAANNSVAVYSSSVVEIAGGYSNADATNNSVTMYGSSASKIVGGDSTTNNAANNSVTMYSSSVGEIFGGASTNNSANGMASHNSVKVYDSIVASGVAGGYTAGSGNADYNSVEIHNSIVQDTIYGGISMGGSASANHNTVRILGGTIGNSANVRNIAGGQSGGKAEYNTVILSGAPVFVGTPALSGGIKSSSGVNADAFLGNTLVLDRYRGTTQVSNIANFHYFAFTLDENSQPLEATGAVAFGNGQPHDSGNFIFSKMTSINTTGSYDPQVGDEITLIKTSTGMMSYSLTLEVGPVTGQKLGGANAVTYKWDTWASGGGSAPFDGVFASLEEKIDNGIRPQTKSLLEGRLGGTVSLTQAADLLAGQGMREMLASVSQRSFSIWGAMGGGTSRYSTGSHISTHGIGFMVGAAWRKHTGPGTLALSPFFAFGRGNYTSHNAFAGVGSVKGKGNTNYEGGGLMARYGHTNTGWYGEASFQLGHVKQDFKTHDFLDNYLNLTKYAISQRYTGLHFGIGKEIAFSTCSVLDVYGKYFWTHTGKKDRDISGDIYEFAAVNSHRARFGARYTYTAATGIGEVKPYAGAAYEYEFNGKGRGTVNGYRIADTRLQGSTGLLEAGIGYAPTSQNWTVNAGATGFVGKRRGIMGQLGARADF